MPKKLDIDKELEYIKTKQPSILKCSYNMARRIRARASELRDLNVLTFLSKLRIIPSDRIPDHIVFFCDENERVLRMLNLAEQKRDKRPIIIGEN